MSNHEFGSTRERSGRDLFTKTGELSRKALAMVLSGTAVLGLTGCSGDKVPRKINFTVSCSDPDGNNQAPRIDNIQQDGPHGEKPTKLVELACPDDAEIAVYGVDNTTDPTPKAESIPRENSDGHIVTIDVSCSDSGNEKPITRASTSRNGQGQGTFVVVFDSNCDINSTNISK